MSVPATATVNAYEVSWAPSKQVYHYDVQIIPQFPTRKDVIKIGSQKGNELVQRLQASVAPGVFRHHGAYDGKKNLYAYMNYNIGNQEFHVPWDDPQQGRNQKYVTIKIAFVRVINTQVLDNFLMGTTHVSNFTSDGDVSSALSMLNLFVQSQPRRGEKHLFKANSFYAPSRSTEIRFARPLQIWRGFFQSVRPTVGRLLLNVDITLGAVMPVTPLETACLQYLNQRDARELRRLSPQQLNALRSFLRGLKVNINLQNHRNKKPKVIKDVVENVGEYEFSRDGQPTSIRDHFYQTYNHRIDRNSLGVRVGKYEIFPITLCILPLQLYKAKLSPEGVASMMDASPRNPAERMRQIRDGWPQLGHGSSEFLQHAGINISSQPLRIQGRLLQPPDMFFGSSSNPHPLSKPGVWDVMRKKLAKTCHIHRLVAVNLTGGPQTPVMQEFIRDLRQAMNDLGIGYDDFHSSVRDLNPAQAEQELFHYGSQTRPNLIIVILAENAADIYRRVKRFGDISQGVVTQCVRWSSKIYRNYSARSCNQYHNNLILKINGKMGGVNYIPKSPAMEFLATAPVMVIGADVSHPGPGSMLPSIASVVASFDKQLCRYAAKISVQRSRQEIIQDLQPMLAALLKVFLQKNQIRTRDGAPTGKSHGPRRIIFFRDGVSEGEFEEVRNRELFGALGGAMREVLESQGYGKPDVTFVVVGKRHHFRFFPDNSSIDDKSGNCKSGFVADNGLKHPVYSDFYLQSQPGLKGTSIPAHYTVLMDEIFRDPENYKLQQVAYSLCHCYARATRSVKIPAPVYYADLVCRRAKFHFPSDIQFSDDGTEDTTDPVSILANYQRNFSQINELLKDTMYFL